VLLLLTSVIVVVIRYFGITESNSNNIEAVIVLLLLTPVIVIAIRVFYAITITVGHSN
jgi:hypothetical protein